MEEPNTVGVTFSSNKGGDEVTGGRVLSFAANCLFDQQKVLFVSGVVWGHFRPV